MTLSQKNQVSGVRAMCWGLYQKKSVIGLCALYWGRQKKGESQVCEFCAGYFEKSIKSMVCGKFEGYFPLKSRDSRIKKA